MDATPFDRDPTTKLADGVFVSNFRYAYNVLTCTKQKCLVHLLRELERVWKYKDHGGESRGYSERGIENLSQNQPVTGIERIHSFK
jgi:hypothetical protein